jgi:hypothetical protein
VNPRSDARGFDDLEGYEREAWIDPARNLDHVLGPAAGARAAHGGSGAKLPTAAELDAAVLFETAGGLGAKLRNTHLVGGERVKEVDFFVASVRCTSILCFVPNSRPLDGFCFPGACLAPWNFRPPLFCRPLSLRAV